LQQEFGFELNSVEEVLYRGAAKEEGYCANSDLRGLQDHMNFHGDGDCVMRHSTLLAGKISFLNILEGVLLPLVAEAKVECCEYEVKMEKRCGYLPQITPDILWEGMIFNTTTNMAGNWYRKSSIPSQV